MKWARLVLVVILVVGSASIATAECAWVLWQKVLEQGNDWKVMTAFEDRRECVQDGQPLVIQIQRQMEQVYAAENPSPEVTVTVENRPGGYRMNLTRKDFTIPIPYMDFVCLPDTIDPREKK